MWTFLLTSLLATALADTPVASLDEAPRARFEAAEAAWALGELNEADRAYQDVLELAPDFDRAWRRRCGVMLAMGDPELAADYCRKAVELVDSHENRTGLALTLLQLEGGDVEAKELIDRVTTEQPDYLQGWVALCTWAVAHGKEPVLATCLEHLTAVSENTPGTLYFRAMQQALAGDVEDATATLRFAREKGLGDDLTRQGAQVIAKQSKDGEGARKRRAPKPAADDGTWSLADLIPLLIAGGLALAVGVLAFGQDDDDDADPA